MVSRISLLTCRFARCWVSVSVSVSKTDGETDTETDPETDGQTEAAAPQALTTSDYRAGYGAFNVLGHGRAAHGRGLCHL